MCVMTMMADIDTWFLIFDDLSRIEHVLLLELVLCTNLRPETAECPC
jgi:hypothetical protein